jgi:hypothetical protein
MKKKILRFAAIMLGSFAIAAPALANTYLFPPGSGAAFHPVNSFAAGQTMLLNGIMYNLDTANSAVVEASLGRTTGGANQFNPVMLGNNISANGVQTFTCTVIAQLDGLYNSTNGLVKYMFTGSINMPDRVVSPISIDTNVSPSSTYAYTIRCTIPKYGTQAAGLVSVFSNH